MCGIFGIWHPDKKPIDLARVQQATNRMRHRGPDDEGYLLVNTQTGRLVSCGGADTDSHLNLPRIEQYFGEPFDLAFGYRRLAILDLSPAGHQPMCSPDGRYWIVYNGEIYNYLELKDELQGLGYTFSTESDTEVLLTGFSAWKSEVLTKLVGMFAFCIFDTQEDTLFFARDFFGIKPLYYTESNNHLIFSSEIKPLVYFKDQPRQVEANVLYPYLQSGLTDYSQLTFFRGVYQMLPAHFFQVYLNKPLQISPKNFWRLSWDNQFDGSFEQAAEITKNHFHQNICLHLRSDVAIGSALSGGIDSSAIVGMMRNVQGADLDLHTFSFLADDPSLNEERWVDLVNQATCARAHKTYINDQSMVADIKQLVVVQEEPFGSTSIYAQKMIFESARKHNIKVMENGQGGDELLGGYSALALSARLASLLTNGEWHRARHLWQTGINSLGLNRRMMFRRTMEVGLASTHSVLGNLPIRKRSYRWLNEKWFSDRHVSELKSDSPQSRQLLKNELSQMLTTSSLPMLLRYEDRNSMACSMESRVPFLTPQLASFIFSLPEEYIVSQDGWTKSVFRCAMRDIVPDAILNRRDKIGFATPERRWLMQQRDWVTRTLASERLRATGAIHYKVIQDEWTLMASEKRLVDSCVWRWLNLAMWAEAFDVDLA